LAGRDLITPERVIRVLKLKPDSTSEEDRVAIARWVEAASSMIREETGREFDEVVTEARTFHLYGANSIYLPELLDTASIQWVRDASGAELPQLDYTSYQSTGYGYEIRQPVAEKLKGCYLHLHVAGFPGYSGGSYPPEHLDWFVRNFEEGRPPGSIYGDRVAVMADWGYAQIPAHIAFQAERIVRTWYKQLDLFAETQAVEEFGEPSGPLPSPILAALKSWKIKKVAVLH
jgi:hypothetical protein